jgi:hypothetical protein
MSIVDDSLLSSLGIELVGGAVEIPLYTRKTMTVLPGQVPPLSRAVPTSLSYQYLVGLVLQITDPMKFIRYEKQHKYKKGYY